MEKLFNEPILNELFELRSDELSSSIIKTSEKYNELLNEMQEKLKYFLNYVPGEMYQKLEQEFDDFLFEYIYELAHFWNDRYYKIGFADAMKIKKEVEQTLEELFDEESFK